VVERNASGEVRAAGGIIVRTAPDGTEILLVHRPAYDDWSFPKGKAEAGETDEACARREVEEETGLVCDLVTELPTVRYVDHKGRPKVVRYWMMTPVGGNAAPHAEVDEVQWVPVASVARTLTYDHDRLLLRHIAAES
jgi:8-oxo-dGTP diphosphatase